MPTGKYKVNAVTNYVIFCLFCRLLEERAALIAGTEDSGNKEVQVSEETVKSICEKYEPEHVDKTVTEYDTQGMIMDRDDTFDGASNSPELNYDLSEEMNPREYGEETASSLWAFVFSESDEQGFFSDVNHDQDIPTPSFATVEDTRQSDNKLLPRQFDCGEIESRADIPMSTLTLPLHFETKAASSSTPDTLMQHLGEGQESPPSRALGPFLMRTATRKRLILHYRNLHIKSSSPDEMAPRLCRKTRLQT